MDATQTNNGTVLIVDDTPTNLEVLQEVLASAEYEVLVAIDGESAIEQIKYARPDIILLDVMMPGLNGFETCERLKANPETASIPVIFMTALSETADKVKGFETGAVDYITKPFQHSEVLARVKTQMTLSTLQKDLEAQVHQRTAQLEMLNASYRKFLPEEFLQFLSRNDFTEMRLGDHVQAEMTVFFADIHGWTTMSEGWDANRNFKFVVDYFSLVGPVIRQKNGFIDQYYGDGIMALFPTSPDDALNAAITMQQVLHEESLKENPTIPPIRVGFGMHTGELMLGIVGESERMQGAVVSDNVNLASRMEGLTRIYGAQVIISETTFQKIVNPSGFRTRYLDSVKVKGRKGLVRVFEVYNGDPPEVRDLKDRTRADFEEGIELYKNRQFAEASVAFTSVNRANPEDRTAKIYLERAAHYMVHGVPEDWDGVEAMTRK